MRLVFKLSALLIALMALVAGYRSWQRYDQANAALEAAMRRHHLALGRTLRVIAEDAARRGDDSGAVGALVTAADGVDEGVHVAWSPDDPGVRDLRQDVVGGELVSVLAVHEGSRTLGAIRLSESLEAHRARAASWRQSSVSSMLLVVLAGGVLSVVLGRYLVAKPVAQLCEKARRIGRGDLDGPISLGRSDELGDLGEALDAACEALRAANQRAAEEAEAKEVALRELRHAERLATVGKLAAGLAHELGTPLSIVSGHAQMIAEGEVPAERIPKSAAVIDREASRMGRIIRQLLDFARRKGPEGEVCDVVDVTKRCLLLVGPMMDRRHCDVELEVPVEHPRAVVDADSLHQIVTNLVSNALQALPELGGRLHVSIAEERATPPGDAGSPRPVVRLDVADTGTGIPDDVLPHIFEPFFTTKDVGDGTGLGLSVVYGIVRDHAGWIDVRTNHGGTTFSVFLPRAEA
jgi:signal transduction histidine kinase